MSDLPPTGATRNKIVSNDSYASNDVCRRPEASTSNTHFEPVNTLTGPEDQLWLTPIQQCITGEWGFRDNGLKPEDYFTLVESTGRMIRDDKRGSIDKRLAPILQRLDIDVKRWIDCMRSHQQMIGSAIGHNASRVIEASRRGLQWIRNRCALFADST